MNNYDVIVIGGGHAGTEACLAASRMGANTLLLTHKTGSIGQMSCNPAIGGIGKSHLVREIDALGGVMAQAADRAAIQLRILNSRKGPAVRATRAQADRLLYKEAIKSFVDSANSLTIVESSVDDLIIKNAKVHGVVTENGNRFYAPSVVLTTGTFLGGSIHIGMENYSGGRTGDPASIKLAQRLRELPFTIERLKTGTPPRIDSRSVDFSNMTEQWGDNPEPVMSFMGSTDDHPRQVCCWITHTNEKTHDIIRSGLDRSPLYTGIIEGEGPRYCPSIEDKISRFAYKNAHQIFVEPEGLTTYELYPNGVSTSLPKDIQESYIHSIAGFEQAQITQYGYAIEYDFIDPRSLHASLETKCIQGLFFAGQINGTTGYEEAGAQGLLAGMNAVLRLRDKEPWVPTRDIAYMGVLVDDLITLGTKEPYRMFTSRAEYRLLLREDNADQRLTEIGYQYGMVTAERWRRYCEKRENVERETQRLKVTHVQPDSMQAQLLSSYLPQPINRNYSLLELIKRPELNYQILADTADDGEPYLQDKDAMLQIEINAKYEGYVSRQLDEIQRQKLQENQIIPGNFNYRKISGLSNEVVQKLETIRPTTIGQASRISGVTPAAISLLLVFLKKHQLLANNQLKDGTSGR